MTTSGQLKHRVSIQRQALDDRGQARGPWVEQARCAADFRYLRGGEAVMAQRLQGTQPVIVAVRASGVTRLVNNAWRLVNVRTRQIYDIKAAVLTDDLAFVEITALAKAGRMAREGGDLTDG